MTSLYKSLLVLATLFIATSFLPHDLNAVDPRTNAPLLYSLIRTSGTDIVPNTILQNNNTVAVDSQLRPTSEAFVVPIPVTINGIAGTLDSYQIKSTPSPFVLSFFDTINNADLILTFNSLMTGGTWQTSSLFTSNVSNGTFTVVAVPEPATMLLLSSATAFTALLRKKVKKA